MVVCVCVCVGACVPACMHACSSVASRLSNTYAVANGCHTFVHMHMVNFLYSLFHLFILSQLAWVWH